MTFEDVGEARCKQAAQQFAQAALKSDGADVVHAALFVGVLEQRNDDTCLPAGGEDGRGQTQGEQCTQEAAQRDAACDCHLPDTRRDAILAWR